MDFRPDAPKGAVRVVFEEGSASRFTGTKLYLGYGKRKPLTRRVFVLQMRKVVALAKQHKIKTIALRYADIKALAPAGMQEHDIGTVAGSAFVMAGYEHRSYKSKPKEGWADVEVVAITATPQAGKEGFWRGHIIATEVNACRELANTPGGDMTPGALAAAARAAAKGTKATVKVLGRKEMKKLGMGAVLGMARGSAEEPKFIIVEYWGASPSTRSAHSGRQERPIVLVGKGVTFDMGGLNIKTGEHMYEMHMDMSGGAAAIHAVVLAAKLKVARNVVALVPSVENALAHHAVRPGDILTSLSGKTIEILNTDAEGRVIVADGITYAKRYDPALLVDIGTFTGGAVAGNYAAPFATNEKRWGIAEYMALAEESGDYIWPVPLWEEFNFITRSTFGDVPNIPTVKDRGLYTVSVGKFLEVFAKELSCPWLHLDIGARMTATTDESLAKGAAGSPVRLLLALIEQCR